MSDICTYPKCDCGLDKGHFDLANDGTPYACPKKYGKSTMYVTDPAHGGKVTCHKCHGFIEEGTEITWTDPKNALCGIWFHTECYNPYDHYYGLDKPVD